MKRRRFLAVCFGLALAPALAAQKDPRFQDYLLEKELFRAQQLAYEATEIYRKWRDGGDTARARADLQARLKSLGQVRTRAAAQVFAVSRSALTSYWDGLGEDLAFLAEDMARRGKRATRDELQRRWRDSVRLQRRLINLRRAQLRSLQGEFYTWKGKLLDLQLLELALASELASALIDNSGSPDLQDRAVDLYRRVSAMSCPAAYQPALKAYLGRFGALRGICDNLSGPLNNDPELMSNLKNSESEYRRHALECEQATLKLQADLLGFK